MKTLLIKNASIVNEGSIVKSDLLIKGDSIEKIGDLSDYTACDSIIDATGLHLIPGAIDDQVHFREPGLIHKADIRTESKAAAAGGITSFMEMPNTNPQTTTIEALEKKYELAATKSTVNYSFYLGATNDNIDEIKKIDPKRICGLKVFMGSSTGNMLVNNETSLRAIFSESPTLIATHCEDEATIVANTSLYKEKYGEDIAFSFHPIIRSAEACYKSSSLAVELATKYGAQLHVLHLSSEKELSLFSKGNIEDKKITGEACVHHLWFDSKDYDKYGARIKWNPSVKDESDKLALLKAVIEDKLDVIATDHAPHTLEEKNNKYFNAPSGGPLVQHALVAMLELYHKKAISLVKVVEKMCHNPAKLFKIEKRGFIREGYKADLVLIDLDSPWKVTTENILYKCKWSPFEDTVFSSKVCKTIVNGKIVYDQGRLVENIGDRLSFNR